MRAVAGGGAIQLVLVTALTLMPPAPHTGWVGALRLVRLQVPGVVHRGEAARLECLFDLGTDRLYSVTWYKDHEEFYRYVPRSQPSQHSYNVDGVAVDTQRSDSQRVLLRSVELRTSGLYRCEVSAEAPSFTSVHGEAPLQVVALPREGPEITGAEGRIYRLGEVFSLNCTSGRSWPPAKITWFVNDRQVSPEVEWTWQLHGGLAVSLSGLRLRADSRHFSPDGRISVRCRATVSDDSREALLVVQGSAASARAPVLTSLLVVALASQWRRCAPVD